MGKTALCMEGDAPVLVLCDRGLPDIAAYMREEQYAGLLAAMGTTPEEARDSYDAVIHLVSVTDGAPELYGRHNNAERYETAEEALRQEMRVRECWEGAAHLHVIPATREPVAAKMEAALAALGGELGWD
jgi:predicted ATPase